MCIHTCVDSGREARAGTDTDDSLIPGTIDRSNYPSRSGKSRYVTIVCACMAFDRVAHAGAGCGGGSFDLTALAVKKMKKHQVR